MLIEGIAGRFIQRAAGTLAATLTGLTSLRVAQLEGAGDEATRAGMRFIGSAQGATGIAPVQAIPSTAAAWMLWNPQGNTVCAFIDRADLNLVSGVAGAGAVAYAIIVPPTFAPTTLPTVSAANVKMMNCNPVSAKMTSCILVASQTLVNAAVGNWFPVGVMDTVGTVVGQVGIWGKNFDIPGKIVLPPGSGLGLTVLSPTGTTPLYAPLVTWREYATDLE